MGDTVDEWPKRPADRNRHTKINFGAKGHARVGGQFGVVNGDVHIYDIGPAATPRERFEKALNLLKGNMPRQAEKLISEAVGAGFHSHEVAYYWALSILSGRSFDHLGTEQFAALERCSSLVDPQKSDEWLQALGVIAKFINCLIRQERFGNLPDQEFDLVIREYGTLAYRQRDEIRRHLDLIMTGALQDLLDTKFVAEAEQLRMANNRTGRAWKFFEPIPHPPRPMTLTAPQFGTLSRIVGGAGAAVASAALLVMLVVVLLSDPVLALLSAAGTCGGGYLLATKGRSWLVARERIAADDARHGEHPVPTRYSLDPPSPASADDGYTWGDSDKADEEHKRQLSRRNRFRSLVPLYVNECFADQNPDSDNKRRDWYAKTKGLSRALAADIQRRYDGPNIGELGWLITWHAKQAKKRWENDTLRAHRADLAAAAAPRGVLAAIGAVAVLYGLLSGVGIVLSARLGLGLSVLAAVTAGGWAIYASKIDTYLVRRDLYQAESALAASNYAHEQAAFEAWAKELDDRPSDDEMARWLDYDKFHAKHLAMSACGLANRDIVAHAILTEAWQPCRPARVLFGPPHYSRYRVIVFLLTEAGLRQISLYLDFLTGFIGNQARFVFRYASIESARVAEIGVRFDAGRRIVIAMDDHANGKQTPKDVSSLILSQGFLLSLLGGEHIDVVIENFDDGFLDRFREDKQSLYELALDTSGIRGALRILESVAAEGREWLAHERARRNRRLMDFSRAFANRKELPWSSDQLLSSELER